MLPWLSLALCYAGFVALALSMPRHHEELRGGKFDAAGRWRWRAAGAGLLGISVWPALARWPNVPIAISAWLGIATVAAFALAMVLTWSERENRGLFVAMPVGLALFCGCVLG